MPEAVEMDRKEVVSNNLVNFVAELESAILDGYEVLFDEDHFPSTLGFLYSCWLVKNRSRRTREETLEIARLARKNKREDYIKEQEK